MGTGVGSWSRAWGASWGLSWGLTYEANQDDLSVLEPAGHWKNLFKPLQNALVDLRKAGGKSNVRFFKPATTDGRQSEAVFFDGVRSRGRTGLFYVTHGCSARFSGVRGSSSVRARVRGHAVASIRQTIGKGTTFASVFAGATVTCKSSRGMSFVSGVDVRSIQNPTEEMIMAIFS